MKEKLSIGLIFLALVAVIALVGLIIVGSSTYSFGATTKKVVIIESKPVEKPKVDSTPKEVELKVVGCYDSDAGYAIEKFVPGYVKIKYEDNSIKYFPDRIAGKDIEEADCDNNDKLAYNLIKCVAGTTVKVDLAGVPKEVVAAACLRERLN